MKNKTYKTTCLPKYLLNDVELGSEKACLHCKYTMNYIKIDTIYICYLAFMEC